jgi:hypothetical protein
MNGREFHRNPSATGKMPGIMSLAGTTRESSFFESGILFNVLFQNKKWKFSFRKSECFYGRENVTR